MIVGVTGKSGSGKSTLTRYLNGKGYFTIDVDILHKQVTKDNFDLVLKVFEESGYGYLEYSEKVSLFFKDKEIRNKVNAITFDLTVQKVLELCMLHNEELIIVDAPLLFEMGMHKLCDVIWYVYCSKEENIRRLMCRNGLTYEKALDRYNALDFSAYEDYISLKINTCDAYKKKVSGLLNRYNKA